MSPVDPPAPDGSSEKLQHFDAEPPMVIDVEKRYTAKMVTSKGTMVMALDPIAAPRTVNNFVYLARYHYFDGIVFHRIIPGFVIQGGDPEGTGRGGPGYRFA
ncbi:MAG TPA: peptidylprolyl isomerase, partial [Acidimicrobiales bacterium]|nr:peptidylprolyl isomerase [Acidimicrobiales bacterium]